MDGDRFDSFARFLVTPPSQRSVDELSRSMARGLPRRTLLARLGAGGLGAALLGVTSADRVRAAVPVAQAATCQLDLVANVRLGASAGTPIGGSVPGELRAQLSFGFDDRGAITSGSLRLANGQEVPVVGQALGRALHLRVATGNQLLVLVGTAEQDLGSCQGAVDGMVTGPQAGDLGDWHATATALGQRGSSSGAASGGATGSASGGASSSGASQPPSRATTGAPTTQAATTAAATTAPPTTDSGGCPEEQTECDGTCVDLQSDPTHCGDCFLSCPAGRTCSAGTCVCAEGTTDCLGTCCTAEETCVEGRCTPAPGAVFCNEDQAACGGVCVDPFNDTSNCGGCGIVCPAGLICYGGGCVCPEGTTTCGGSCCAANEECLEGQCVPKGCGIACAPGLTPCAGAAGCTCCEATQACNDGLCV